MFTREKLKDEITSGGLSLAQVGFHDISFLCYHILNYWKFCTKPENGFL